MKLPSVKIENAFNVSVILKIISLLTTRYHGVLVTGSML